MELAMDMIAVFQLNDVLHLKWGVGRLGCFHLSEWARVVMMVTMLDRSVQRLEDCEVVEVAGRRNELCLLYSQSRLSKTDGPVLAFHDL